MDKVIKFLIGVLFIPVAVGFSKSFYVQLAGQDIFTPKIHFFLWGALVYMIIHVLVFKPMLIYVFGHEVIHVLATWLCGGHITSFKVSSKGGAVSASKSNIFIELSPYFIPIYSIILLCLTPFIKDRLFEYHLVPAYIFLIGFTMGMHVLMNAEVMKEKQPDILKTGYMLAMVIIYIVNLMVIYEIMAIMAKDLSFKDFFVGSIEASRDVYVAIWDFIFRR